MNLASELACTVCYDVPIGSIWSCSESHIMCEKCQHQWSRPCPQCRLPVASRNRILETIRDTSTVACECGFNCRLVDLTQHKNTTCPIAPLQCPCSSCWHSIPTSSFVDHMLSLHPNEAIKWEFGRDTVIDVIVDGSLPNLRLLLFDVNDTPIGAYIHIDASTEIVHVYFTAFSRCTFPAKIQVETHQAVMSYGMKLPLQKGDQLCCATTPRSEHMMCIRVSETIQS